MPGARVMVAMQLEGSLPSLSLPARVLGVILCYEEMHKLGFLLLSLSVGNHLAFFSLQCLV